MANFNIEWDASLARKVATHANAMMACVGELEEALTEEEFSSTEAHMDFCAGRIRPLMDATRASADALEALVADELWPLPKYQEMLFIK